MIGHFYLTKLLLPTLVATAASSPDKTARVVTTSSGVHLNCSNFDYATFKNADGGAAKRKKMGSMALYSQSKLVRFLSRSLN